MATILSLLKRFEAIDTDKICVETMEESTGAIAEKNKEQLFSGENAEGSEIKPGYTPFTIAIKQSKGQPTDRVTLRDTGSFYQGIYVNVQNEQIVSGSTDVKTLKLLDKYGNEIFGLNDRFKIEVIRETVRPLFNDKIENATGLKINK